VTPKENLDALADSRQLIAGKHVDNTRAAKTGFHRDYAARFSSYLADDAGTGPVTMLFHAGKDGLRGIARYNRD
jgi:hypothetical protein